MKVSDNQSIKQSQVHHVSHTQVHTKNTKIAAGRKSEPRTSNQQRRQNSKILGKNTNCQIEID